MKIVEGLTTFCMIIQSSKILTSTKHQLVEKLLQLGADVNVTINGVNLVTWAEQKLSTGLIEFRTVELLRNQVDRSTLKEEIILSP